MESVRIDNGLVRDILSDLDAVNEELNDVRERIDGLKLDLEDALERMNTSQEEFDEFVKRVKGEFSAEGSKWDGIL